MFRKEKLQDNKLVRQRLNHSTKLGTKNKYKKRGMLRGLIIHLDNQKSTIFPHGSKRSILPQTSDFFTPGL